jgi:hypothetical protein
MKTCTASGFPDESLQLFQAIEGFVRQYRGIPIIQSSLEKAHARKEEGADSCLKSVDGKVKVGATTRAVCLLRNSGSHS